MNKLKLSHAAFLFIALSNCLGLTVPASYADEAEHFLLHHKTTVEEINRSSGRIVSTASFFYEAELAAIEQKNGVLIRFDKISHSEDLSRKGDDIDPTHPDVVKALHHMDGAKENSITFVLTKQGIRLEAGGQSVSAATLDDFEAAMGAIETKRALYNSAICMWLLRSLVVFDVAANQPLGINDEALAFASIRPPLESGPMYRPTSFIVTGIDEAGNRLLLSRGILTSKSGRHVLWESHVRKKAGCAFPVSMDTVHTSLTLFPHPEDQPEDLRTMLSLPPSHPDRRINWVQKNRTQIKLKRKD